MKGGNAEGVDELTFIDPVTGPAGSLVERVPVLGKEQGLEKQDHFPAVLLIEKIEDFSALDKLAILEFLDQFLNNSGILRGK